MEEKCCAVEKQSLNDFMRENNKLIEELKGMSKEIECNIFGAIEGKENIKESLCLLQAVENQNIDLREILQIMLKIRNTLIAK